MEATAAVTRRAALGLVVALAAGGCAHARPSLAIHWVRSSAEYRALCAQTYALAAERVAVVNRPPRSWAVILDADETVLDNSLYQKERAGRAYSEASWAAWVRRREAGAVPGARAFLETVRGLGGVVAIVTNRSAALCDDTRANLTQLGLPYDVVLCQAAGASSDKQPRFRDVAEGRAVPGLPPLEIAAYVGDNIRDFPAGSQALRDAPPAGLAPFGTSYFLLPNPMYGSWEKNPEK